MAFWLGVLRVAVTSQASAFNVYKIGGEGGNAWDTALSFEPGTYAVLDGEG